MPHPRSQLVQLVLPLKQPVCGLLLRSPTGSVPEIPGYAAPPLTGRGMRSAPWNPPSFLPLPCLCPLRPSRCRVLLHPLQEAPQTAPVCGLLQVWQPLEGLCVLPSCGPVPPPPRAWAVQAEEKGSLGRRHRQSQVGGCFPRWVPLEGSSDAVGAWGCWAAAPRSVREACWGARPHLATVCPPDGHLSCGAR